MSTPSAEGISDEADSEVPSTEVPTTESDVKTANNTSSTIATVSTSGSGSGSRSGSASNSADASGSASASGSNSSVKKSSGDAEGDSSSSPTGTPSGTGTTSGAGTPSGTGTTSVTGTPSGTGTTSGTGTPSGTGTTGDSGGSDDKPNDGEDGGGEQEQDGAPQQEEAPATPPKPKLTKMPKAPMAPTNPGQTDAAGDVSMQYEKRFKKMLAEKRKAMQISGAEKVKNKPNIDELNSYYKAWVMQDFEKQQEEPKSHDKEKKRRQDEIRQRKAQEAFCTWLRYKKQQLKMERRCYQLRQKERRQLVRKRSRAESEAAYNDWLRAKWSQHSQEGAKCRTQGPPVVFMRDMSALHAKSYKKAMADQRRTQSAGCARRRGDTHHDVENVYCPEHKTEYQLVTKRTASGSCYRLTSVRKLDA